MTWTSRGSGLVLLAVASGFGSGASAQEIDDADMIFEAQQILYERGWDVGEPDGRIGSNTRKGIREYQRKNDLDATGELSQALYDRLVDLGVPEGFTWGAISASTDRAYSANWNRSSRLKAERDARSECRRLSSKPGKCATASTFDKGDDDEGWIVAINCSYETSETEYTYAGVSASGSLSDAMDTAYETAEDSGYDRHQCSVLTHVAVDGSHDD